MVRVSTAPEDRARRRGGRRGPLVVAGGILTIALGAVVLLSTGIYVAYVVIKFYTQAYAGSGASI